MPRSSGSTDLEADYPDHLPLIDQLDQRYEHEAGHASRPTVMRRTNPSRSARPPGDPQRRPLLRARGIIRLRDDGVISDDVLRRIERDLDLEALRSGA